MGWGTTHKNLNGRPDILVGFQPTLQATKSSRSVRSNKQIFENAGNTDDALDWFQRISKPDSIRQHPNIDGGFLGNVEGSEGIVGFRPYSSTFPNVTTLDLHNIPGYDELVKIKFLGEIFEK